jgi:hypothetical protein
MRKQPGNKVWSMILSWPAVASHSTAGGNFFVKVIKQLILSK